MPNPAPTIVCHAGSASDPAHVAGPRQACTRGLEAIQNELGALGAAVAATRSLEDDHRFNAGTGSNLRLDGTTIQMDASCMTENGDFGAVAAIERVKNPVEVARLVMSTPHILLVGDGATTFARRRGVGDYDPTTQGARDRLRAVTAASDGLGEWTREGLERAWNFETPLREALGSDTVGSVAWDGEAFAGALSSGGTTTVLRGRVGDVPLPGCGLYVGEHGAVAATGDGEYIARALLAYRAYGELERGRTPAQVVEWALGLLAVTVDVGLIVLDRSGFAGGARHGMAWHGETTGVPA
jgi:L-asparaginase / beta-aspartyl-peptidase